MPPRSLHSVWWSPRRLPAALEPLNDLAGVGVRRQRIALLQTCDRYASTLTALAAAKAHGRLSAQQIDAVDTVRLGLNPICESPPVLDYSVAAVLPQVTEGVRQLLSIEAQVEIANDAR